MTTLSQECISLELAKELKALGVVAPSLFYWYTNLVLKEKDQGIRLRKDFKYQTGHKYPIDGGVIKYYAAYTCSELGKKLPKAISHNGLHYYLLIEWMDGAMVRYEARNKVVEAVWNAEGKEWNPLLFPPIRHENETESRGLTVAYLLKSNLITVEEINKNI